MNESVMLGYRIWLPKEQVQWHEVLLDERHNNQTNNKVIVYLQTSHQNRHKMAAKFHLHSSFSSFL